MDNFEEKRVVPNAVIIKAGWSESATCAVFLAMKLRYGMPDFGERVANYTE